MRRAAHVSGTRPQYIHIRGAMAHSHCQWERSISAGGLHVATEATHAARVMSDFLLPTSNVVAALKRHELVNDFKEAYPQVYDFLLTFRAQASAVAAPSQIQIPVAPSATPRSRH